MIDESSPNFLSCPDHWLRRKNHAVEIDHANAVAEAGDSGLAAARVQRHVNQREYGQHEEEERSSPDQNPE